MCSGHVDTRVGAAWTFSRTSQPSSASAERKALNLVVVGSSPTVGVGVTSHVRLRLASRHAMFHVLARDVRCASWRVVKKDHSTVTMVVCSVKAKTLLNFGLSLGRHST